MQASQTLPDQSFGFAGVVAAYGEEVAAPDKRRSHGWNNSLNHPSADVCHGAPQFSSRVYQRPMMLKILCGPIVHVRTSQLKLAWMALDPASARLRCDWLMR